MFSSFSMKTCWPFSRSEERPLLNPLSDSPPSSRSSSRGYFRNCQQILRDYAPQIARGVVGVASLVSTAVSSVFAYQEMQEVDPDPIKLTGHYLNIGLSLRLTAEAICPSFSPSSRIRKVHNFTTWWSYETYLVLWNAYLNSSAAAQPYILNTITALFGYQVAADSLNLVHTLTKRYHADPVEEEGDQNPPDLRLYTPIISRLLSPDYDNLPAFIFLHTLIFLTGVAGLGFTSKYSISDASLSIFVQSGSYLAVGNALGSGLTELGRRRWVKGEIANREALLINGSDSRASPPFKVKVLRGLMQFVPIVGAEVASSIPISPERLYLFGLAGLLYGGVSTLAQPKFQLLTPELDARKKSKNYTFHDGQSHIRTSLLVDIVGSVLFFYLFTSFFNVGSVLTPLAKGRVDIAVSMQTALVTVPITLAIEKAFVPGKNNRLFNQLYYLLFGNPLFLSMSYMLMRQVSQVDSQDLNTDSPPKRAFGLVGLALYVVILTSWRLKAISLRRSQHPLSSSNYRMIALMTLILRCQGKLPTN
jgi:hypothetical protein